MSEYLIRYRYPGTTNGKPVGDVYVQAISASISPGSFSYCKEPEHATRWPDQDAAELELARRTWRHNGGHVVALEDAEVLS